MYRLFIIIFCFSFCNAVAKKGKIRITGQKSLTVQQGQSITIQLSDLVVDDPDQEYPSGFTLEISNGRNYHVSGSTVTPDPVFSGMLYVSLRVKNGKDKSEKYDLLINVTGTVQQTNTAPVITGQRALEMKENTSLAIGFSDLTVNDPDNSYPQGFIIKIFAGANYFFAGTQITPDHNFVGILTIPVRVNDGHDDSPVFNMKINVTPNVTPDVKPVITGQSALTITRNQPLLIQFSHLTVTDSDNHYPTGFTLKVYAGINYTFSETVVTPARNFTGTLSVKVTVNDGIKESDPFLLQITVQPGVNVTPVITGQIGLSTYKNEPLAILLTDLVVNDPDNNFPADFRLNVLPGDSYAATGAIIKPLVDFVGTLAVNITVNDGNSSSEPYKLIVKVLDRQTLQITGQHPLAMLEDSTMTLALADLIVNDPANKYPMGFELKLLPADNFNVSGNTIAPVKNFNGNLVVPVQITNGTQTSPAFNLLVVVQPVNDAPEIADLEPQPLTYSFGTGPTPVTYLAKVIDADDENLIIAEAGIDPSVFQSGHDELTFSNTENIHGIFDPATGIASFIGLASLAEYQNVIRSVQYQFVNMGDSVTAKPQKSVYFKLNDGKTLSSVYSRQINMNEHVNVDIPNAFTPNDDQENDTWQIEMDGENANYISASVHVYSKSGLMVFHTERLEDAWDGKWKGDFLPPDTYFYIIEVNFLYTKKNFKGVVSILR